MDLLLDGLSWVCLVTGSCFCIIGGIGLLRLPDFYTRIHAGGITDTMGAGLVILGLALQAGLTLICVKLLLILGFLWLASATTAHAMTKAALASGLKPLLHGADQEELKESGPSKL
ncbi:MAG: monovalent cation/H(+) antiporter subunit G [Planctomycetota bacterium]